MSEWIISGGFETTICINPRSFLIDYSIKNIPTAKSSNIRFAIDICKLLQNGLIRVKCLCIAIYPLIVCSTAKYFVIARIRKPHSISKVNLTSQVSISVNLSHFNHFCPNERHQYSSSIKRTYCPGLVIKFISVFNVFFIFDQQGINTQKKFLPS